MRFPVSFMASFDSPDYLQLLKGGVFFRFVRLRDRAQTKFGDAALWRKARAAGFHNWASYFGALSPGFQNGAPVMYCHTGAQFRDERFSDEILSSHHKGWYTNHFQETFKDGSGIARGIVGRLTHGRFVAGYHWGDNGERVYFPHVYADEDDAARAADSHAESFAESCRDDSEKSHNAGVLQDKCAEICARILELFALRNHRKIGQRARDEIRDAIESLREKREELKNDYADYI